MLVAETATLRRSARILAALDGSRCSRDEGSSLLASSDSNPFAVEL